MGQWVKDALRISMRMWVRSLASFSGLRIWCCHKLPTRSKMELGSGVVWLWRRLAAAALIQPLAWELPYATGAALKTAPPKKNPHISKGFFLLFASAASAMKPLSSDGVPYQAVKICGRNPHVSTRHNGAYFDDGS